MKARFAISPRSRYSTTVQSCPSITERPILSTLGPPGRTLLVIAALLIACVPTTADAAADGQRVAFYLKADDASGSATYIGGGRFLTAAHVLRLRNIAEVWQGQRAWRVTLDAADYDADLALLTTSDEVPARPLSWATGISPGTNVLAVGYPAPFDGSVASVSAGIISALRTLDGVDYLQLDATVNPGNSGGPVVTLGGGLAGIIVARVRGSQNLNLAVAASVARSFLEHPVTRGLDPAARELSDEYLAISRALRDAAVDLASAREMLGQFPQTLTLSAPALNISTRLSALQERVRALPSAGRLGDARSRYLRAIELTSVDQQTYIRIWAAAGRGNPNELLAVVDRAHDEWLAGDVAAHIR